MSFSLLHWAEGGRTGKIQLFLNGRDSCVQAWVIKEMLKASEGQTKVIKVMKYLHKCLGDNMFLAEGRKKRAPLNGSGLSEGTDRVSQLREQQEVWPQPERGASSEYNHGRCDVYRGSSITEAHVNTKA